MNRKSCSVLLSIFAIVVFDELKASADNLYFSLQACTQAATAASNVQRSRTKMFDGCGTGAYVWLWTQYNHYACKLVAPGTWERQVDYDVLKRYSAYTVQGTFSCFTVAYVDREVTTWYWAAPQELKQILLVRTPIEVPYGIGGYPKMWNGTQIHSESLLGNGTLTTNDYNVSNQDGVVEWIY